MKNICSGEAAALKAASGDHCQCADCKLFFPGMEMFIVPEGDICQGCKEERADNGLNPEVFGQSPRDLRPPSLADFLFNNGTEHLRSIQAELHTEGLIHRNTRPHRTQD